MILKNCWGFFFCLLLMFVEGQAFEEGLEQLSQVDQLTLSIQYKIAHKFVKKYDMKVIGDSAAMPEGIINNLGLLFQVFQVQTREQAREILVDCVQEFLSEINSNKEIRPHLKVYPFTAKNITIDLYSRSIDDIEDLFDPDIMIASARFGKIWYKIEDENQKSSLKSEYEEAFDEAVKLVNIEKDSDIFPPRDGKLKPLKGKIIDKRYYAPENVFSCEADDFGQGGYLVQDALFEVAACVGFYNTNANFKKAEVFFTPPLEKKRLDRKALRNFFDDLGIGILKKVDNAQGIEVLEEKMVGEHMLFIALSIEKMSVLKSFDGKHMSSTRGCLIFQEKDKVILLTNQEATPPSQDHQPRKHTERLKKEIIDFQKTFKFGAIPTSAVQEGKHS